MIVGTAGHIDHGKTTLVRALHRRGHRSPPAGRKEAWHFHRAGPHAFLDVPGRAQDERIGFIDVPGHERLVHTMLAGATGIDFALLLVAADDGVMPQTREHLAVLSLLGLARGAVAITKVDPELMPARATRGWTKCVPRSSALLAGSPLSLLRTVMLAVSAHHG